MMNMMAPSSSLRMFRNLLLTVLAVILLSSAWLWSHDARILDDRLHRQSARDRLQFNRFLAGAAGELSDRYRLLHDELETLSIEIARGSVSSGDLQVRLDALLESNPLIDRISIVHAPRMDTLAVECVRADVRPPLLKTLCLPLQHPVDQQLVSTGQLQADVSLERLRRIVSGLELGERGYPILVDRDGHLLLHPQRSHVLQGATLASLAHYDNGQELTFIAETMLHGEAGDYGYTDKRSGGRYHVFYHPVNSTGWTLALVVPTNDENGNDPVTLRLHFRITAFILFALLAAGLGSSILLGIRRTWILWLLAGLFSLIIAAAIGRLWMLIRTHKPDPGPGVVRQLDFPTLERYKHSYRDLCETQFRASPSFVPTGIAIQMMELDKDHLTLVGHAWQRLPAEDADRFGLSFPDAETLSVTETHYKADGDFMVKGWQFRIKLRVEIDHSAYPFECGHARLRLWHPDFHANTVLTPDMDAYPVTRPDALPGIRERLTMPGWKVEGAGFIHLEAEHSADFGLRDGGITSTPQLGYDIVLRREFLTPFISNLLPLIIIALLIFLLMQILSERGNKVVSATVIIRIIAYFFFVVVLAQIELRSRLGAEGLIYLEYFYFLMYATFLAVSLNTILFGWGNDIPIIHHRDNIWPKLLFWPVILLTVFCVTMIILCP